MNKDEIFYAMALTRLTNFNYQQALELYKAAGSAQALYEHRHDIGDMIDMKPNTVRKRLSRALSRLRDILREDDEGR